MEQRIRVAIVVEALLGGIRQHVYDIVCGLDSEKYEVYFIYSDLRADETFYEQKKEMSQHAKLILCNEMQREIEKKDYDAYRRLVQIFQEIKPDIVHCHSSKAGFVGRLAAKHCKVKKIIYTPHAYAFQSPDISKKKKMLYIWAEKFLSRYACSITINVSKGEMNKALEYHLDKPDKFTLIYNGIPEKKLPDRQTLRERLGLRNDCYYVGFTGRCAEQKDPFTFLQIAKNAIEKEDNVEFLYIGDGDLKNAMEQWISEHGLQDKIHMLGFRKDASEIVGVLDIYLSTALYEGLPYSMIEAMRAGVPIIATDCIGNNELVFDGINGKMFPVRDKKQATNLVISQLKKRYIEPSKVLQTFQEEFSLMKMLNRLLKIYQGGNT